MGLKEDFQAGCSVYQNSLHSISKQHNTFDSLNFTMSEE